MRSGVTQTEREQFPEPGLTFSTSNGVDPDLVTTSRNALAAALDVDPAALQFMRQVHGSTVVRIDAAGPPPEADALITNVPGIVLCATIADCCAILLVDPVERAVAAIHSGWRGTHRNIAAAAVQAMRHAYGTDPRNLAAFLSPCASGERYEVGEDVAVLVGAHVRPIRPGTWLFDNQAAIRAQLIEAGLLTGHIDANTSCTIADARYHSHRRDGRRAGRGVGFVGIR